MQMKAFNVRLAEEDLKRLDERARKRGVTKTALLRDWIRGNDDRTVGDLRTWEERNLGNKELRIRCD
jgi:predicted DNA-binding protein